MRHRNKNKTLSRKSGHRKSMLSNMGCSLIMHKRIKTTLAKAKVLKQFIEPVITRSKTDTTHSRRIVFSYLQNKHSVRELFDEVSQRISDRPGGYTRIIKLGNRLGDNANLCLIELIDFNQFTKESDADTAGKKKTRRRRKSKNKAPDSSKNTESKPNNKGVTKSKKKVESKSSKKNDNK